MWEEENPDWELHCPERGKPGLGIALPGKREKGPSYVATQVHFATGLSYRHPRATQLRRDKRGHSQPFDWHTSLITTPDQLTLLVRTNPVILVQA